jgi:hypothetical protein
MAQAGQAEPRAMALKVEMVQIQTAMLAALPSQETQEQFGVSGCPFDRNQSPGSNVEACTLPRKFPKARIASIVCWALSMRAHLFFSAFVLMAPRYA